MVHIINVHRIILKQYILVEEVKGKPLMFGDLFTIQYEAYCFLPAVHH